MTRTRLRIAVIAPSRFPIAEPFVGGLEAHVWLSCAMLRARGHHVTLFAATGSDLRIADRHRHFAALAPVGNGRQDVSNDRQLVLAENRAYESVMAELAAAAPGRFDVVHNHSLHPLPLALADGLSAPMLTTLHTPPLPAMVQSAGDRRFVAVSRHTARSWAGAGIAAEVVHNGVDTGRWIRGPGGADLIWFGRLVPEKGPDFAIEAARLAGRRLHLAGPIVDQAFFEAEIRPRLSDDVRYLGHLEQQELIVAVGSASVAVVTPTWDEPYGLVVAEALSCGTPVAAFRRGGIPEILTSQCGVLATPDDPAALAQAVLAAARLSRGAARRRAIRHCSVLTMVEQYEHIYHRLLAGRNAAPERDDTTVSA